MPDGVSVLFVLRDECLILFELRRIAREKLA
jgi:hypothetical protein